MQASLSSCQHAPCLQQRRQPRRRGAPPPHAAAATAVVVEASARRWRTSTRGTSGASSKVAVQLTSTSFSSRKLQASVDIRAPPGVVWGALTDYDNLGSFIPSLVENRCIERRPHGALLYQVGAQDVAMGIKFSAACTLEIKEWPGGIPERLVSGSDMKHHFPRPPGSGSTTSSSSSFGSSISSALSTTSLSSAGSSLSTSGLSTASTTAASSSSNSSVDEPGGEGMAGTASSSGVADISFNLIEGDFQSFKGVWRVQAGSAEPGTARTTLHYSLFVRPHPWLPVKLIEDRISSEVANNLTAVRRHAEGVHKAAAERAQRDQQLQPHAQPGPLTTASSVGSSSGSEAEGGA